MVKAALILLEGFNDKLSGFEKFIYKATGVLQDLIHNKVENIELEDFNLNIIRIPKAVVHSGRLESRLKRLSKWLDKEGIKLAAFDENIESNYDLKVQIEEQSYEVFDGMNLFFSFEIRILKKLLKSKGLEINDTDIVIVSDGLSKYERGYIKYLSPYIKYLTYVSDNIDAEKFIEDLFNDFGFSVRICKNIKQCIGDAGLVINLTKNDLSKEGNRIKKRLVIRNIMSSAGTNNSNITVLNDIKIDISSKFKMQNNIENKYKYRICEMYILSKLGKLYLLKQNAKEDELKEIYDFFKNEGFKIGGLEGANL